MTTVTAPNDITPDRCDKILSKLLQIPRSVIKNSLQKSPPICNGKIFPSNKIIYPGDVIEFEIIELKKITSEKPFSLDILFEDDDVVVVNKSPGIVVHPAQGVQEKTLVEYVSEHCSLCKLGDKDRPGVVHRLDKDTSGCIVFAKSNRAFKRLTSDFADHVVEKQYTCIVKGNPTLNTGKIEIPIARQNVDKTKMIACSSGKYSKTTWIIRERFENYTWLDVKIFTGRTHQIRVHMNYIGHPVAGDVTYDKNSKNINFSRIMLHAELLSFSHPQTGNYMTFKAIIPQDFLDVINNLKLNI